MKRVVTFLLAAIAFVLVGLVKAPVVLANEGRIDMASGNVSCEGVSVWESDRYHLVGRCQGLVYPYAERLDRYMLWVRPENGGNPARLEEVERGLFDAQTEVRFGSVFITAEEDNNPRQPGSTSVVSGDLSRFDFAAAPQQVVSGQPTPTPKPAISVSPTPATTQVRGISFGQNAVINLVLIGVLVVVVLWILFFLRR